MEQLNSELAYPNPTNPLNIQTDPELERIHTLFSQMVEKYYNYPISFVEEVFKATPTKQQKGVLQALNDFKKVSVRAGHGVGKSTVASWAVYWFLLTRPYPKIICTAPTFHQLYDVLWAEMAKWRRNSELVSNCFEWTQRRIEAKWAPREWFAAARTADKAEGLQGRHADHFLLVIDEASGIPDEIFEASEGMLTGENAYVLMLSNPTRNSGYFYESHNKDRNLWSTHILPCKDSPLVSLKYISDMGAKYGIDSNVYRVRVLGEFPLDDEDTIIPNDWARRAIGREVGISFEKPVMGVDVGAGGDKSAMVIRQGGRVHNVYTSNTKNTMEVVGWVALKAKEEGCEMVYIDPIGIGKGAYDRLVEMGIKVCPVDVRYRARKQGFKTLRDELWWNMRTQFEQGNISLPEDDDLVLELTTPRYFPQSDGTIKIESKKEMRSRGLHSPDKADALCMTYYYEDTTLAGVDNDEDEEEEEFKQSQIVRNRFTGY